MLKRTTAICKLALVAFILLQAFSVGYAQENSPPFEENVNYDSLLDAYLAFDSLLLADIESDTITFLDLIDSLMAVDFRVSTLSFRAGYTSSILNAGRDYGFKQYGFSGGASYYHKSGFFADALAYWNSELNPKYYLNTFSLGYIGTITKGWSIIGSYDFLDYRKGDEELEVDFPLTNALNVSSYYDLKFISAGVDYSFLFGTSSAHRLRPSIAGVIRTGKLGLIDRITFMPGASLLLGNTSIITTSTNQALLNQMIKKIGWRRFLKLYERRQQQIDAKIYTTTTENVFGLMNYSFSLPIYINAGNFTLMASYSLNLPVELPGENLDTTPNSYFGTTLVYNIIFK